MGATEEQLLNITASGRLNKHCCQIESCCVFFIILFISTFVDKNWPKEGAKKKFTHALAFKYSRAHNKNNYVIDRFIRI